MDFSDEEKCSKKFFFPRNGFSLREISLKWIFFEMGFERWISLNEVVEEVGFTEMNFDEINFMDVDEILSEFLSFTCIFK